MSKQLLSATLLAWTVVVNLPTSLAQLPTAEPFLSVNSPLERDATIADSCEDAWLKETQTTLRVSIVNDTGALTSLTSENLTGLDRAQLAANSSIAEEELINFFRGNCALLSYISHEDIELKIEKMFFDHEGMVSRIWFRQYIDSTPVTRSIIVFEDSGRVSRIVAYIANPAYTAFDAENWLS